MTEGSIYGKAPQIDLDVELSRQRALLDAIKKALFNLRMMCLKAV